MHTRLEITGNWPCKQCSIIQDVSKDESKFNINSKSFTLRISDKENMGVRKELLIHRPIMGDIPCFHTFPFILSLLIEVLCQS